MQVFGLIQNFFDSQFLSSINLDYAKERSKTNKYYYTELLLYLGCEDLSGILCSQLYSSLPNSQLQHMGQLFNLEFR